MHFLDATFDQYLFCLVFYLYLSFSSLLFIKKKGTIFLTWLLIVAFCVFSYFAGDWFNYKVLLPYITSDYKDPIYYYFAVFVKRDYLLFRLLIWGIATFLVYLTSWKLNLRKNITAFIFIWTFLPTFCYARASLAMASYFCGLSFIVSKSKYSKIIELIIGISLIFLSFLFHRSFLPVIVVTPLVFVKINRKIVILLVLLFPYILKLLNLVLNMMMDELVIEGEEFESFSITAQSYAKQSQRTFNWKYMLVSNLKYIGFYIVFIYLLWKTKISKHKIELPIYIDRLFSIEIIIIVVSTAFFYLSIASGISDVLSYRYLFISGIPSVLILTHLIQTRNTKIRVSLYLMFCVWLSTIGLMVGKLYALS